MACGLVSAAGYTPAGEQAQIAWAAQLLCGHLGFITTNKGLSLISRCHVGNLLPFLACAEDDKAVCTGTCRVDDDWHHVAVTWEGHTGAATLYFDGKEISPFWRASGGRVDQQYPAQGGVDKHVAAGTARFDHGEHLRLLKRCASGLFMLCRIVWSLNEFRLMGKPHLPQEEFAVATSSLLLEQSGVLHLSFPCPGW